MVRMTDEIKDENNMFPDTADNVQENDGALKEKDEVWGAAPLEEKGGSPQIVSSSPGGAAQVSQEEADALVKGLEGLDMLGDSIPEIPNLEEQGAGGLHLDDVASMSAIDDIIASVQGTQFDMSPGPAGPSTEPLPEVPETRPASFPSLDPGIGGFSGGTVSSSMQLLMDIPIQLSVILGRTRKTIGEVLELEPGAIVELDKLAGEPVEVLANGKLIVKGEVVVIDESFGIRVTELVAKP